MVKANSGMESLMGFDIDKHMRYVKNKMYLRPCEKCGKLKRMSNLHKHHDNKLLCLKCRREIV